MGHRYRFTVSILLLAVSIISSAFSNDRTEDSKDYPAALRHLEKATIMAPHEVEIQLGLAWLSLSAHKVNTKQAVDNATEVVRMTAGRDWFAIACLAAAYSHDPKSTLAMETLEAAIRIAPACAMERCEKWRSCLNANEAIKPDW